MYRIKKDIMFTMVNILNAVLFSFLLSYTDGFSIHCG